MIINKSKYCGFCQCPKTVWLRKNKPEEFEADDKATDRTSSSVEICDLQRKLFKDFVDVATLCGKDADLTMLVNKTTELINNGVQVINKASFMYNNAYCMVDILKKESEGYSVYRTKSSTSPNSKNNIIEVSYQKYILQKCGLNIVSTNVINVNTNYVYKGKLDITKLFKITNVDELVDEEIVNVESNLQKLKEVWEIDAEPNIDLNVGCNSPYPCGFWKYCSKHLKEHSVFDLYATSIQKKISYYNKGIVTFKDLKNSGEKLGNIQTMQLEHCLEDKPTYVNKQGVKDFLNTLWYPLYFLDFETIQQGIPKYKKARPYQPIPFQYSLHYIESVGGEVKHKEFLANPFKDPRRQVAKQLFKDIPANACILAYNKYFERDRIKDLAKLYTTKRKKFNKLSQNVKDLIDPFTNGFVYNKYMGNSMSIKSILPALYPNDKSLNYNNLNGVQNGNDAMIIYPKLKNMSESDRKGAEQNLLEYCKLDTYAMVKIYQYLIDATNER